MIRVLITDKLAQEGVDLLNSIEGVEPVLKVGISAEELAKIIGEYDGLIIRSGTRVTADVLAIPGKLKAIARAGVGVDNIDIAEATRKGILVMNTPGGNTLSAAEHTFAMILSLSRKRRSLMHWTMLRPMMWQSSLMAMMPPRLGRL